MANAGMHGWNGVCSYSYVPVYAYIYLDPEKEPIEVDARCDFANQKPDS